MEWRRVGGDEEGKEEKKRSLKKRTKNGKRFSSSSFYERFSFFLNGNWLSTITQSGNILLLCLCFVLRQ